MVPLVRRRTTDHLLSAGKVLVISSPPRLLTNYAKPPQTHFHQCSSLFPEVGCEMFTNEMSRTATTMSLSILVTVEMFNAMNSLSENESLLRFPVWRNPFLVASIILSMVLHCGILYIPFFTASRPGVPCFLVSDPRHRMSSPLRHSIGRNGKPCCASAGQSSCWTKHSSSFPFV